MNDKIQQASQQLIAEADIPVNYYFDDEVFAKEQELILSLIHI